MASENAKAVADKVIEKVRKGEKVVLGEIIKKQGYGKSMPSHPNKITKTKSYQKRMSPLLDRYQDELNAILEAMKKKNKNSEQYRVLVEAADKIQKQIQLLSGGDTSKEKITIGWEE